MGYVATHLTYHKFNDKICELKEQRTYETLERRWIKGAPFPWLLFFTLKGFTVTLLISLPKLPSLGEDDWLAWEKKKLSIPRLVLSSAFGSYCLQ